MPTSIWTHAEREARSAIETSLRERQASEHFQAFYRKFGPACVGQAIDNLGRPGGMTRLHEFVRNAVARHLAAATA